MLTVADTYGDKIRALKNRSADSAVEKIDGRSFEKHYLNGVDID